MSKGIAIGTEAAGNLITKVRKHVSTTVFRHMWQYLLAISCLSVCILHPCSFFVFDCVISKNTHTHTPQGGNKLREKIEPNEKATEIPQSVQKGVHVAKKASGTPSEYCT